MKSQQLACSVAVSRSGYDNGRFLQGMECRPRLQGDISEDASVASNKAGGMTSIPAFRNAQPVIFSPSRRSTISQRTVANDPVTDKLGPRSTPIRTASR